MAMKVRETIIHNKKVIVAISVLYLVLLVFMVKMIGIGATVSIFLFLALCTLPALFARALGEKGQAEDYDDRGGYRFIYSYRFGSKFGDHQK